MDRQTFFIDATGRKRDLSEGERTAFEKMAASDQNNGHYAHQTLEAEHDRLDAAGIDAEATGVLLQKIGGGLLVSCPAGIELKVANALHAGYIPEDPAPRAAAHESGAIRPIAHTFGNAALRYSLPAERLHSAFTPQAAKPDAPRHDPAARYVPANDPAPRLVAA